MSNSSNDYGSIRLKSHNLYKAAEAVIRLEALVGSSVTAKNTLLIKSNLTD